MEHMLLANPTGVVGVTGGLHEEVESFILALLARDESRDVEDLRAELARSGDEMPYDSILLVELMSQVQLRFGVRLEPSLQTARDLRSVRGFADRVCVELAAAPGDLPANSATSAGDQEGRGAR